MPPSFSELAQAAASSKVSASDLPTISKALLEAMDRLWPERSPNLSESHADLMWRGGQRSVIRKLQDEFRRQNENILNR